MWKLDLTLDALKGASETIYTKTFIGNTKEEVVQKSARFIQIIREGGWQIAHMSANFTNLGN